MYINRLRSDGIQDTFIGAHSLLRDSLWYTKYIKKATQREHQPYWGMKLVCESLSPCLDLGSHEYYPHSQTLSICGSISGEEMWSPADCYQIQQQILWLHALQQNAAAVGRIGIGYWGWLYKPFCIPWTQKRTSISFSFIFFSGLNSKRTSISSPSFFSDSTEAPGSPSVAILPCTCAQSELDMRRKSQFTPSYLHHDDLPLRTS